MDIAVCDIVCKKEGVYHEFFNVFYPFVKEHFLKNYDKLMEFAQKIFEKNPIPYVLKTSLYLMNITLDYENLVNHFGGWNVAAFKLKSKIGWGDFCLGGEQLVKCPNCEKQMTKRTLRYNHKTCPGKKIDINEIPVKKIEKKLVETNISIPE